ncbi:MAG: sigma-70 domain-containing protein [Eubacteriales bacterium]|nr:sigma-70 domain-containing protein [Eubacteriales bacterium]
MREEQLFAQTLEKLCAAAKEQGGVLSERQVEEAFAQAGLAFGAAQLELVYGYLKGKKIGIGEPADPFDYMTREEIDYLEEYLKQVQERAGVTDGEKEAVILSSMAGDPDAQARLVELFLPQVAELAKLYAGQGVYLEDLIGEGNVALAMAVRMLDCEKNAAQAEGSIASMIMEAMENYISECADEKRTGEKLAAGANDVLEQARELSGELGRKVTVQELSEESGLSEEQIREAVRITADHIEYLDLE